MTIVVLHHFGGSRLTWTRLIAMSADIIALDLPGFGDQASRDEPCTSVDAMADAVAAEIERREIERYVLCGHSMGGKIAFALAARRPPKLERLVLVAPSPPTPEPMSEDARARLLRGWGDEDAARETNRALTRQPLDAAALEALVRDNLRTSARAWRWWLERGSREDLSACCASIEVPVTLVIASDDPVIPRETLSRDVVGRIANVESVVVTSGHLVPLEAPATLAGVLRRDDVRAGDRTSC